MLDVEKMFLGVYTFQCPKRIIFGNGAVNRYGEEVKRLNGKYPLIITDKGIISEGLIDKLKAPLDKEKIRYEIYDGTLPDAPIRKIEEALGIVKSNKHDLIIGFGGGSSIDTAKMVSVMATAEKDIMHCFGIETVENPGLPKVFTPTTAGTGSELSTAFVCLDDKTAEKRVGYSQYASADVAIVDPTLTLTLPPKLTAETGFDALSHAVECYVTAKSNPFSEMFSLKGIQTISRYIRRAYAKGQDDLEARYFMCLGVHEGTLGIRSSGTGACPALAYPPQVKYHLSHAVSVGVMLPYVMEYNLIGNLEKYANVAQAMGERIEGLSLSDAAYRSVQAIKRLLQDLSLPSRLKEVGAKKEDFQAFSEMVPNLYKHLINNNPRDMRAEDVRKIYESAW